MKTKRISIQLTPDRFDRADGRDSLDALLKQAAEITSPGRDPRRESHWIIRWAIRAVCEEIIRTGEIPLPLQVRFETTPAAPNKLRDKIIPLDRAG